MRYLFRRNSPPVKRILLIESGSRHLFNRLIPALFQMYGENIDIDLVTCFAGVPDGFRGEVFRVTDYPGPAGRKQLHGVLAARQYFNLGIICSSEPIMTKWKWWLAAKLPVKVFVVNENCDFFWVEAGQWRTVVHFALFRAGLTGAAAVPALARLLFFPLTVAYLLLYAGVVHLRRWIRML